MAELELYEEFSNWHQMNYNNKDTRTSLGNKETFFKNDGPLLIINVRIAPKR